MKEIKLKINTKYNENDPLCEMVIPVNDFESIEQKDLNKILAQFINIGIKKEMKHLSSENVDLSHWIKHDFYDLEGNEYVFVRNVVSVANDCAHLVRYRIYKAVKDYTVYEQQYD